MGSLFKKEAPGWWAERVIVEQGAQAKRLEDIVHEGMKEIRKLSPDRDHQAAYGHRKAVEKVLGIWPLSEYFE